MNRHQVWRFGAMSSVASLTLFVLAACGSGSVSQGEQEDVTRVAVMSDAAVAATNEALAGSAAATPEAGGGETVAAVTETAEEAAPAPAASVEVVMHDIYFEPKEITIPADTDVKILLPNEGAAPHNFIVEALNVSVDVAPGETGEATINASAGEYEFHCNVPGHKEAGMVGKLTVTAGAALADEAAPAAASPAAVQTADAATPAAAAQAAEDATPAPAASAADTEEATPAPAAVAEVTDEATPAPAAAAQADTVEIATLDIYFEPKEITIPAGTDVKINVTNNGAAPHSFFIDALGIALELEPGAASEVVINAPAGVYDFFCNVPGHKEAGMVGVLTVQK